MMMAAEVSLYPKASPAADQIINSSISALADQDLEYDVGELSTRIVGMPDEVWTALRSLFERAESMGGEVAMVATLTTGDD